MSRAVVLDSEALSLLARGRGSGFETVRAALEAARRLGRDVVVPAVILAELYRGPGLNQVVDGCLARESFVMVRDTDRDFARFVGGVLAAAGAGSADLADAHVVAATVECGGGVVLTGDDSDMRRLSSSYSNVDIVRV